MKYIKCVLQILLLFILCNDLHAQVPVIKEPHHKPVLVNNYVRLLDVHIKPGDTTLYHIHAAPSVIVEISRTIIGLQKKGEAPSQPSQAFPGSVGFSHYETNPVTHRVFNAGDSVFHVMDIELVKTNPSPDSCNALPDTNIETVINEKLVRVYKFDVSGKSFHINKSSCAHLLVCISGKVNTSNKTITTGEYAFFNPNTEITLNNKNADKSTCVLLELK